MHIQLTCRGTPLKVNVKSGHCSLRQVDRVVSTLFLFFSVFRSFVNRQNFRFDRVFLIFVAKSASSFRSEKFVSRIKMI